MSEHPDPKKCLVVAGISGGKDSTALDLFLADEGIERRRVFADTGWEHPATVEQVERLKEILGPIDTVVSEKYPGGFADMVRKKGMFPSRLRRFCTQELKVFPIMKYIAKIQESSDLEIINAVGIRAGESAARAKMTEWEWSDSFDCWVWRPLLKWTEADVIAIHKAHGISPNPLYLKGARRVGCWPCIFANKGEIAMVGDLTPERIDEIRALEAEVQEAARKRYAAKGETFESLGYKPPTMFHDSGRRMTQIPIDKRLEWARTARGGKQLKLHPEYDREQEGCMRWGLCEPADD